MQEKQRYIRRVLRLFEYFYDPEAALLRLAADSSSEISSWITATSRGLYRSVETSHNALLNDFIFTPETWLMQTLRDGAPAAANITSCDYYGINKDDLLSNTINNPRFWFLLKDSKNIQRLKT